MCIRDRNKRLVALVYADYEALDSLGLNQPDNLKTIMETRTPAHLVDIFILL